MEGASFPAIAHLQMKSLLSIAIFLSVALFPRFAWVDSIRDDHLVYVFATGPDLYDPAGKSPLEVWHKQRTSKYAKKVVNRLIDHINQDRPNAYAIHLTSFTPAALKSAYMLVRQIPQVERIVLLIVAHGGVRDGAFYMWSDSGEFLEKDFLEIIAGTPTHVALFTCNSGAIDSALFPGPVFGASLKHTSMDAAHFYGWVDFQETRRPFMIFPDSALEIHDSWLHYRIDKRTTQKALNESLTRINPEDRLNEASWGKSNPFFLAQRE